MKAVAATAWPDLRERLNISNGIWHSSYGRFWPKEKRRGTKILMLPCMIGRHGMQGRMLARNALCAGQTSSRIDYLGHLSARQ